VEVGVSGSGVSAPKSPVQVRLEQRWRARLGFSQGATPVLSELSLAKKRREEMLQTQVKQNARRVRRAKEVARRKNEERRKESECLAEHISDKLSAAESRREEFLREVREKAAKTSSPPCSPKGEQHDRGALIRDLESKIMDAEFRRESEFERRLANVREHLERVKDRCEQMRMIKRVQNWWRRAAHRKSVVISFQRDGKARVHLDVFLGPLCQFAERPSFETVAQHLGSPEVIRSAQVFFDELRKSSKATTVSSARFFLAALMIDIHPETVLGSDPGHQEVPKKRVQLRADLRFAAVKLCYLLRSVREENLGVRKLYMRLNYLRQMHLFYNRAFLAWKQCDALCLAEELLATYVQITEQQNEIKRMIGDSEAEDPGLLQHMQGTTEQLTEIRTRVKKVLQGETEFKEWLARAEKETKNENATDGKASAPKPKQRKSTSLPQAPKSLVQIPSNEQMVHELMLDSGFKLEVDHHQLSLEEEFLSHKTFTQNLVDGQFDEMISLVEMVRDRLATLTPNREDLKTALRERLDISLLQQQLEAKVFNRADLYSLIQFIGERILALQAPARQEQTEAWLMELHAASKDKSLSWQDIAPKAFDRVLRELGFIDVDMANYHLAVLASHLEGDKGLDYLRKKFAQRLRQGEYHLGSLRIAPRRTEAWLLNAFNSVNASSGSPDHATPSLEECLIEGISRVLSDKEQFLPETLAEFDATRISQARSKLVFFCRLAVADMIVTQVLRTQEGLILEQSDPVLAQARIELSNLLEKDDMTLNAVAPNIAVIAERIMQEKGTELTTKSKAMISSLLTQASGGGTLMRTVNRQLENVMRKLLREPDYDINQLLKKIGLLPWAADVTQLGLQLHRLHILHFQVHHDAFVALHAHNQNN